MPGHIVYSMAVFFKVAFAFAVPVLCALSPVYQTFVVALICTVKPRYMVGAVRNNSTRAERVSYCKGRYERIGIPEVVRIVPVVCAGIVFPISFPFSPLLVLGQAPFCCSTAFPLVARHTFPKPCPCRLLFITILLF